MLSQVSRTTSSFDETFAQERGCRDYSLYGISLRSEIPLAYADRSAGSAADVTISVRDRAWFSHIHADIGDVDDSSGWYDYARLPDGADFLRWPSLFEFVVSGDGSHVAAGHLENASSESFQSYLLGWVLSFALVKQGYEPLHATAVVVDGKAVAFLGTSGQGKSTLAASFLHAGYKLLTDDLLLIREVDGVLCGFPGPPRIKLFPHIAERFLPQKLPLGPMNPDSDKIMIPLAGHELYEHPAPMHGFVVLDEVEMPGGSPQLEPLSPHQSFLALVAATFNDQLRAADRLQRQFRLSAYWTERLSVRRARYPRTLSALAKVRQSILREVRRAPGEQS
jgi:hypothetical protein